MIKINYKGGKFLSFTRKKLFKVRLNLAKLFITDDNAIIGLLIYQVHA